MIFLFVLGVTSLLVPATSQAAVIPDAATNFITTWNTENPGDSNSNQITIPSTCRGHSYELYWEDVASSTSNGTTTLITTSSYTLTFPYPGIYQVQASGTIPCIGFNNTGDRLKILTIEQWGTNPWTSMDTAFYGASNLRIPATDAPNLSGATSMSYMLAGRPGEESVFNDPVNHWDITGVTDIGGIFSGSTNFNQPLNDWDTSSVVNMGDSFNGSSAFNQPLNDWDTSSVLNMEGLFADATAFNQNLSSWDVSGVFSMNRMFLNTTLSAENQDVTLDTWSNQLLQNGVEFHIGTKSFGSIGEAALETMRTTYSWDITEQYRAMYSPSSDAILVGTANQASIDSGATTTAVTISPKNNCEFIQWSDGSTQNPRSDTLTDNLTVTAVLSCPQGSSAQSTSARTQARKAAEFGNDARAAEITERFLATSSTPLADETLEETLERIKAVPLSLRDLDSSQDKETIKKLINVLLELVQVLTLLMLSDTDS